MTVSVSAAVGEGHKRVTFAQRERWVPDSDTGAAFVPGHWENVGEPVTIDPGSRAEFALTDDEGQSVKIWSEAVDLSRED